MPTNAAIDTMDKNAFVKISNSGWIRPHQEPVAALKVAPDRRAETKHTEQHERARSYDDQPFG